MDTVTDEHSVDPEEYRWRAMVTSSATMLVFAGEFLIPRFLDVDGFVYFQPPAEEDYAKYVRWKRRGTDWLKADRRERGRLAAVHGEVDLSAVCGTQLWPDEPVDDALKRLADLLRVCWPIALGRQFPDRSFDVEVIAPDDEAGPFVRVLERTD